MSTPDETELVLVDTRDAMASLIFWPGQAPGTYRTEIQSNGLTAAELAHALAYVAQELHDKSGCTGSLFRSTDPRGDAL